EGSLASVLFALRRLNDPRARVHHDRALHATPHIAQRSQHGFSLASTVELEVDHDVVRVVYRAQDPVAAHARPLPADRIVVERRLPGVEVGDWVFYPQDVHLGTPFPSWVASLTTALTSGRRI